MFKLLLYFDCLFNNYFYKIQLPIILVILLYIMIYIHVQIIKHIMVELYQYYMMMIPKIFVLELNVFLNIIHYLHNLNLNKEELLPIKNIYG